MILPPAFKFTVHTAPVRLTFSAFQPFCQKVGKPFGSPSCKVERKKQAAGTTWNLRTLGTAFYFLEHQFKSWREGQVKDC